MLIFFSPYQIFFYLTIFTSILLVFVAMKADTLKSVRI